MLKFPIDDSLSLAWRPSCKVAFGGQRHDAVAKPGLTSPPPPYTPRTGFGLGSVPDRGGMMVPDPSSAIRWAAATGCSPGPRSERKLSGCPPEPDVNMPPPPAWHQSLHVTGRRPAAGLDPFRPGRGPADATPVEGPIRREPGDIRRQHGRARKGDAGSLTIKGCSGVRDARRQERRKMSVDGVVTAITKEKVYMEQISIIGSNLENLSIQLHEADYS